MRRILSLSKKRHSKSSEKAVAKCGPSGGGRAFRATVVIGYKELIAVLPKLSTAAYTGTLFRRVTWAAL